MIMSFYYVKYWCFGESWTLILLKTRVHFVVVIDARCQYGHRSITTVIKHIQ